MLDWDSPNRDPARTCCRVRTSSSVDAEKRGMKAFQHVSPLGLVHLDDERERLAVALELAIGQFGEDGPLPLLSADDDDRSWLIDAVPGHADPIFDQLLAPTLAGQRCAQLHPAPARALVVGCEQPHDLGLE